MIPTGFRVLGTGGISSLPSNLREAEYLTNVDGAGSFFDLGITVDEDFHIELKALLRTDLNPFYSQMFGVVGLSSTPRQWTSISLNNTARRIAGHYNANTAIEPTGENGIIFDDDIHSYVLNSSRLLIDGQNYKFSQDTIASTYPTDSIYLFARRNMYDSSNILPWIGNIYTDVKVKNSTISQHWKTCIDETNRPCIYDLISGRIEYNRGTGEFIAGPII